MSDSADTAFARTLTNCFSLTSADLVLQIRSGNGSRLCAIQECGPRVVGIEPDLVTMVIAWNAGVDTIRATFDTKLADYITARYGPARVILIPDETMRDAAKACLAEFGTIVCGDELPAPIRRVA